MRFLLAAFISLWLAVPAAADQKDPRLEGLFELLRSAPNPAAAQQVEDQIWRIWLEHPHERTREATLIGISFMSQGQARLADLAFKEAIELSPEFAEAWNKRATLRYLTGDLEGSIADCAEVLKLEPRHFGALSGLGLIHMSLEQWDVAAGWFEQALAVYPQAPGMRQNLETARRNALGRKT